MSRPTLRRRALCAALLAPALGTAVHAMAADSAPTYTFSPVNQYSIPITASYWNPIIAHVSEKTGIKLQLKIGRTSADTTSFVLAREVDLVFTNHLFSPERERLGWKVLARRATPPVHGQLVVLADSPITSLAQLAGRDVAYPGPEALVSYKFPQAQLLSAGIATKVVFGGNMDGAFAQLIAGKVAAVGANSQLVEGYARREGTRFRVLWSSPPLHDLALMASANMPEAHRRAIAAAFIGMADDPAGREILAQASKQVGLAADTRFLASDGSEYGAYREFYRSAPSQLR